MRLLRRTLLPLLLALPCLLSATGAHALITREDARQIVITNLLTGTPGDSLSFAFLFKTDEADSVLHAGESILSWDFAESVNFSVLTDTYFAFIDDAPDMKWEHACRYVFIDASTGTFQVFGADAYPFYNGANYYSTFDDRIESPDFFHGDLDVFVMAAREYRDRETFPAFAKPQVVNYRAFAAGDTCGLIIQGPDNVGSIGVIDSAAATDAKRARRFMEQKGVPSNAIKTIRPANGKAMADSIKANSAGKKKIWIYYTGHGWGGGQPNNQGGPWLPTAGTKAGRAPTWTAIACSLEAAGAKDACIVLDCCYSGRAVKAFQDKNINGVLVTSSHADSTSIAWYRYLPGPPRKVTFAESHYTAALDSCFMDAAADSSVPPNGVDLVEAGRWARKDALASKRKPPEVTYLHDWTWLYTGAFEIPISIIDPALYVPFGMASDPASNRIIINLQPQLPSAQDSLIGLIVFPDIIVPSFQFCAQPSPPNTRFSRDIAFGGPPDFLYHADQLNQQLFASNNWNLINPYPIPFLPGPMGTDHDNPLLWVANLPSLQLGPPYLIVPFDVGPGPFLPPIPTVPVELLSLHLAGDPGLGLLDFVLVPLAPFAPELPRIGALGLSVPIPPDPGLNGVELMLQGVVIDPQENPQNRMFSAGRAGTPEVQEPKGMAGLPGHGTGFSPQGPGDPTMTVFIVDGVPAPSGGYLVHTYELGNLVGGGSVSVPGPGRSGATRVALAQSRPNPMQRSTTIAFSLPLDADRAALTIYDVSGRRVRTLANRAFEAGDHTLAWDGLDASGRRVDAGVYFYRLSVDQAGERVDTSRRLVMIP